MNQNRQLPYVFKAVFICDSIYLSYMLGFLYKIAQFFNHFFGFEDLIIIVLHLFFTAETYIILDNKISIFYPFIYKHKLIAYRFELI